MSEQVEYDPWEVFMGIIPDAGKDTPAADFLLEVLVSLTERDVLDDMGITDLVLAVAENITLHGVDEGAGA